MPQVLSFVAVAVIRFERKWPEAQLGVHVFACATPVAVAERPRRALEPGEEIVGVAAREDELLRRADEGAAVVDPGHAVGR